MPIRRPWNCHVPSKAIHFYSCQLRRLSLQGRISEESAWRAVDEDMMGMEGWDWDWEYFISNPELVFRVQKRLELRKYDRETFLCAT